MVRTASIVFLSTLVGTSSFAQEVDIPATPEEARYEACIALVATDADTAFETALNWKTHGGGAPAKHCEAVALVAIGHASEGAIRLERLAGAPGSFGNKIRAQILAQAGDAWLVEAQFENAAHAFGAAATLASEAALSARLQAGFLEQRAAAAFAAGYASEALFDLNRVEDLGATPNTYVLRARVLRKMRKFGEATADLEKALSLKPQWADALFERGELARERGNEAAAREDYLAAILADEKSPYAVLARKQLQKMDLQTN